MKETLKTTVDVQNAAHVADLVENDQEYLRKLAKTVELAEQAFFPVIMSPEYRRLFSTVLVGASRHAYEAGCERGKE